MVETAAVAARAGVSEVAVVTVGGVATAGVREVAVLVAPAGATAAVAARAGGAVLSRGSAGDSSSRRQARTRSLSAERPRPRSLGLRVVETAASGACF